MTRVLAWRVYHEQRGVWLALAALALLLLVLQITVLEPDIHREALCWFFGGIACIHGLMAGAMLLAGEREEGTAAFLEALPVKHFAVWRVKCLTAGMLVLTLVLFLWALLLAANALRPGNGPGLLLALAAFALLGFGWGLFCSGRTQTSMGAMLGAVAGQVVVMPLLFILGGMLIRLIEEFGLPRRFRGTDLLGSGELLIVCLSLLVGEVLIFVSGLGQARLDRRYRQEPEEAAPASSWRAELAALFWLERRQSGRLFLGLAVAALVMGLVVPLEGLGWPVLTWLLGVIAGVAVLAGEQREQTGRFVSEQRLSPGRVWAVKVGLYLGGAVALALLLLVAAGPRLLLMSGQQGRFLDLLGASGLLNLEQPSQYLTVGLGYGFSCGCLFGMLLAKPLVAGMVAAGVSLLLAALWAPSVLVGGLHLWQVWGPPLLVLLATRVLFWPWATGRLGAARARLAGGLLTAAGLLFAWGIAYRVVEVPVVEDGIGLAVFEQAVQEAKERESGVLVRAALSQVGQFTQNQQDRVNRLRGAVLVSGWPRQDAELADWLNETFRRPWDGELKQAAQMPLGVIEDPRTQTEWYSPQLAETTYLATLLLAARGLQRQAEGDPDVFVENLASGLALLRQVCHLAPSDWKFRLAWEGLDPGVQRWLERLEGRPDLLRRVLDLLREQDRADAEEAKNAVPAGCRVALNMVAQPEALLEGNGAPPSCALAWRTPWEQARLQRLIRLAADQRIPAGFLPRSINWVQVDFARWRAWQQTNPSAPGWRPWQEGGTVQLLVALCLYHGETGRPAQTLQELTPRILASLPVDPRTSGPFTYRLSRGESLTIESSWAREVRQVPAGQGILIGGGRTYLVPLPPRR